jgi:RimJ/RimL family protein N-acetyltransferase
MVEDSGSAGLPSAFFQCRLPSADYFMSEVRIAVARPEHQGQALNVVFGQQMTPAQRAQQIVELTRSQDAQNRALDGLLGAWRGDRLVGAVWGQIQPGCSAAVWPPRLQAGEPAETADTLLHELLDLLIARRLKIAQALLRPQDQDDFHRFTAAGFRHMADLRYLVSLPQQWPVAEPASELTYEPSCGDNLARLKRIIEQTFEQTLDCPGLSEIRSTDELLTEYRAIGEFDPALWLIVRQRESDIGCLLLANHPDVPQWELVYVGIVRGARGRGLGLEIVRHAQWLARASHRSRILLAVDTRNEPAIQMYEAAGFTAWEHRSALLRVLTAGVGSGDSQKAN